MLDIYDSVELWRKFVKSKQNVSQKEFQTVGKRIRSIHMPKEEIRRCLKINRMALEYVYRDIPLYGYASSVALRSLNNIYKQYKETDDSLYDCIQDEVDNYGMVGESDVIIRRGIYQLADILIRNDNQWRLEVESKK